MLQNVVNFAGPFFLLKNTDVVLDSVATDLCLYNVLVEDAVIDANNDGIAGFNAPPGAIFMSDENFVADATNVCFDDVTSPNKDFEIIQKAPFDESSSKGKGGRGKKKKSKKATRRLLRE